MADALLEKSPYGYIAEYRDLIGMVAVNIDVDGRRCTVSGIVDSDETAFYLSDLAIAKRVFSIGSSLRITLASRLSLSVEKGKTILLLVGGDDGVNYPKVQSTVKINGVELTLEDVIERAYGYESWLEFNGITVPSLEAYCEDILAKEQPELIKGSQEYDTAFKLCAEENYYFYQSEIYYKYVDAYCKEIYLFEGGNFELWLYVNHGVPEAIYGIALPEDLYKAREYKRLHGEYPTPDELMEAYDSLAYPHEKLDEYYKLYENEFYSKYHYNVSGLTYLVSDEDYIAMSRGHGQTDPSAVYGSGYIKMDVDVDFGYGEPSYRGTHNYSLIHSTDPEATARWLSTEFSHLSEEYEDTEVLITPYDIFESKTEENMENIISSLITIGVMLVFMSICMYFIMRSAMMNRIKEIGIYRAIGVSRGNIIFRFATESLVVTTMTTFLGFLGTSAFVWVAMNMSSLMSEVFYYPLWLAAAVLIVLYGVSILCGVLPVLSLVRRSPSEILAKYDI
jgi:hypothetical protein